MADFGTSRLLERSHATTVIGSPPYMAPEAFQGRAVLASDIYSVGVMLYQMLTGVLPYFSPNPAQIERLVAQGRCTPPKLRNSQIPREVSDIVMKALAPEVAERYQRASELLDDLATVGRDRPQRDRDGGHPPPPARPRGPQARLLLALPQAAARPQRHLRLLRREAVATRVPARSPREQLGTPCLTPRVSQRTSAASARLTGAATQALHSVQTTRRCSAGVCSDASATSLPPSLTAAGDG